MWLSVANSYRKIPFSR
jgi:hypothetical protein